MLNVYPYKAYEQNPQTITLDLALFLPNPGVLDSGNGFLYSNAFDALLDAAYIAMAALNHTDLVIVVSETGWPSLGDPNQLGLSSSNAQTYNSNVLKHVLNKTGTPVRPGVEIVTYLYELFNEDKELGASSARNFGLFHADMSPVYPIDLSGASETALAPPLNPALMNHSWCIAKQVRTKTKPVRTKTQVFKLKGFRVYGSIDLSLWNKQYHSCISLESSFVESLFVYCKTGEPKTNPEFSNSKGLWS
jgi:hypothetical protein